VDNLLPGWSKAPGEAAHATFALVSKSQGTRFEDVLIEATNTTVKGAVEVDASGDVVSANFPVFSLSNRDKAALKADRTPDGTLRVTLRGDLYDGRAFVKSALSGPVNGKPQPDRDIDLDVKLGTVVGFHGETLRGMDLRLSRRSGIITTFALNAKLGRDTPLLGDLKTGGRLVAAELDKAGGTGLPARRLIESEPVPANPRSANCRSALSRSSRRLVDGGRPRRAVVAHAGRSGQCAGHQRQDRGAPPRARGAPSPCSNAACDRTRRRRRWPSCTAQEGPGSTRTTPAVSASPSALPPVFFRAS